MVRVIVFDFGGVVVNATDSLIYEDIARRFDTDYNLVFSISEELMPNYETGKMSDEEFWRQFSQKIGRDLPSDYETLWVKTYSEKSRKNPKIVDIMRRLGKNEYRLACLSNTIPPHGEYNRRGNNFEGFDRVFLSYEVGLRKPDMALYKLVAKKLAVKMEDIAWIDDNASNLRGLPNAIHYQNPEQLELELRRLGVKL